jgi:CubicO group peptidase (beta-lactamase class C family)
VDAPAASYWPEFAGAGKGDIPVRWLLCHKAGLPVIDGEMTLEETLAWDPVVRALAAQKPIWEPGTAHGYHATTYGWLVGEIVRRISGRSVGRFFAEEVAAPLGLELWIGLPEAEQARVAPLVTFQRPKDPEMEKLFNQFFGPDTLTGRALSAPGGSLSGDVWNRPEVWRAEIPAANAVTNARSLARMYAGLVGEVDGVRVLTPEQVEAARTRQTEGADEVLLVETRFGLGFMLSSPFSPFGGTGAFGHPGAGGSLGFADPEANIGFGYVMNKMQQNLSGDPRTLGLIDAVYRAIGRAPAATG